MHNISLQSGSGRRRAPSVNGRRTTDVSTAPVVPITRQTARNITTTPTKLPKERCVILTEHNEPHCSPGGVVQPPTTAAEVETQKPRGTGTSLQPRGPFIPELPLVQPESYPVELSDVSGSESDTAADAHGKKAAVAPIEASAYAHTSARVGEQLSKASKRNGSSRNTAAASSTASRTATAAKHHSQPPAPSRTPPPAAAPHERIAARTVSAVLSVLVVLLAVAAGSSTIRTLLRSSSRPSLVSSSSSDHMTASALSTSQATGAAAAVGPVGAAWTAAEAMVQSSYQAASWLKSAAPAAGAVVGLPLTTSSSSRELIKTAALPGLPPISSPRQQISGVVRRSQSLVHKVASMHSGSSGRSSKTYTADLAPAAVTGDAAAAAAADATVTTSAAVGTAERRAVPADAIHMYAVVDDTVVSPYKGATWGQVINHMAQRLQWSDQRFILNVITQQQLKNDKSVREDLLQALGTTSSSSRASPMFVGIAISDPGVASYLRSATSALPTVLFWDSGEDMDRSSRVDGFAPATASPLAQMLAQYVGFSGEARSARVMKTLDSLWSRRTSDDLLFIWLVLLNEYVTPVPSVADTTKGTDLKSLYCMIKNCGQKIVDCVTDTTCKKGLDCLDGCAFNDQVCQYRCIVSYETPRFEQFALCILQLHNCRGLDAQMPTVPDPAPMTSWRGQPMTHEVAESLFIGWKEMGSQMPKGGATKPYSWLVAAGKNPAYDYFPCQHQLYSYGKGKGQMWYEPVFKAITLDGHEVWRRRRYRVRRGTTPGTFYYSVLDNGVTSNEYWRILDCAEDLTYCLFYYAGAAATAGLSYSGAVLGTADGSWPEAYTDRIHGALHTAGIEPWELSSVDNSQCVGAPL